MSVAENRESDEAVQMTLVHLFLVPLLLHLDDRLADRLYKVWKQPNKPCRIIYISSEILPIVKIYQLHHQY